MPGPHDLAPREDLASGDDLAPPDDLASGGHDFAPVDHALASADHDLAPVDHALAVEERLQHARGLAWGALNRRERTTAEMARLLAAKRVEPAVIDEVVGELLEQGYLDDVRYAERFAEDRRRLDGWGPERIERRLRQLGVAREDLGPALAQRDDGEELEAALGLLRRRFPDPPADAREAQRALGVLVRKGYGLEVAHDALRRHAGIDELD